MLVLVDTFAEATQNIFRFERELTNSVELQARLSYARGWYALQAANGNWHFGPSKFVGYRGSTAKRYLSEAGSGGNRDGRETEQALEDWFELVEPETRLGQELQRELASLLGRFGKTTSKRARISVPKKNLLENKSLLSRPEKGDALLQRITSIATICGGRPIIKGTRMRVSDLVEMFAQGIERAEILADFDYLNDDDISAALIYAARSSSHHVIRAA